MANTLTLEEIRDSLITSSDLTPSLIKELVEAKGDRELLSVLIKVYKHIKHKNEE